jgi:opacity protein-like surface antigen
MRSKLLKILMAVFAVCLIAPAFSAVENVKVGGDIAVYGVLRGNFTDTDENLHFLQAPVRVYVSADLSENVSVMVRLLNEFNFGYTDTDYLDTNQILLDLAYIKVSDLLTPGLSLTVGRQEIQLGEGLVVGSRYRATTYPAWYIYATDLGVLKAFDAIRIDYAPKALPMNLILFGAKITENFTGDDENLYGADIGFKVADVANIDVYFVRQDLDNINTYGARIVSGIPAVEGLSLKAEYAKQSQNSTGWALLAGAEYKMSTAMKPMVKLNYARYSEDWTLVYPSNIGSRIGPILYAYDAYTYGLVENGNAQFINLGFGISPTEKLAISLDGYWGRFLEPYIGTEKNIGYEVDLGIDWKYSEDLTFGLMGGMLFGDKDYFDENPWQIIGCVKVAF